MDWRDIIEENKRRHALIDAPFEPLSGLGSVGERFPLLRKGHRLMLPVAMKGIAGLDRMSDLLFERERIRHDFPYWAARYAYIKSKGGGDDRLFVINRPQRKLVEAFERDRTAGKPIRLILLKARQWGGSTCVQLYMAWLQLVHEMGLNSLIIAHQRMATDEIKDMFDRLLQAYPRALLAEPGEEVNPKEKVIEGVGGSGSVSRIPRRKCKVKVGSAERPDSCRGGDYNLVHCSEVGIWKATAGKSPEMIARAAGAGILLRPLTMIVYESTANGTGNFFHREYEAARRGSSQFKPLFISWFDIDQYSIPVADPERFARRLLEGKDSQGAPSDREQPGSYLWWLWESGATLEAIAWYMAERSKYSDHALMAAEYPSDDVEAFVHSGAGVFDRYKVEALRAECRAPRYIGEIHSPLVVAPGRIEDKAARIRALREVEFTSGAGAWKIWKAPSFPAGGRIDSRYVAVVDVGGRGEKSDWSVIVVFDREPLMRGERPEVVAQWRGHTDFDLLAWRAAMAASLYDDALLVIESNSIETRDPDRETDGDQSSFLLNRLREIYPNLYARRRPEEDIRRGAPAKYGFHTNMATKPLIIATLVKVIREALYIERDEACLDEYLSYERRGNGSFGAILGCHDDLLMTRAIGLHIIFHEMPVPVMTPASNAVASLSSCSVSHRGSHAVW
ncbi:MAG: terminase [Muribaculaceae bacterium]|nr:terminase [Muribaculaceae bacterium]